MVTKKDYNTFANKTKENMTVEEMMTDIEVYVRLYDWVTFAELTRRYGEQAKGGEAVFYPSHPNVILYLNMSENFASAICQLLENKKVHVHAAHVLSYFIDGEVLTLPLAKRIPKEGDYKTLHWLPVCFRPGASCYLKDCLSRRGK